MAGKFDVTRAPTMARFMADTRSKDCGIMSHVGYGKTSTLCVKAQKLALIQPPSLDDATRYTKSLFIRGTHNQLIRATIPTFQKWIPPKICPIRYSSPVSGTINGLPLNDQDQFFPTHMVREGKTFPYLLGAMWNVDTDEFEGGVDVSGQRIGDTFPEGTKLHAIFDFMGLDNTNFVADLLGYECTNVFFDEPDTFSNLKNVLPEVKSRMGRYPATDVAPLLVSQTNYAYNPPPKRSFLHQYFDPKHEHLGRKLYRVQPPFLMIPDKADPNNAHKAEFIRNPDAEGIHFQQLGFDYWMRDINDNRHDLNKIKRRVLGEYTEGSGGDLIHPTFRMDKHVSQEPLVPSRGRKLFASFDHGLTGAMVLAQVEQGGVRVVEEMSALGIPAHEFIRHHAVPHLNTEYRGFDIVVTGDPSGAYARDTGDSPFTILEELGFFVDADVPNDPQHRWSAVNYFLMYDNGLIIDPGCEMLIQGFDSDYTFKTRLDGESTGMADKTKHASAYQDCLQAICQLVNGGYETAADGIRGTGRYGDVVNHIEEDEPESFLWA